MIAVVMLTVILYFFWWDLQEWMLCRDSPITRFCNLLKTKKF